MEHSDRAAVDPRVSVEQRQGCGVARLRARPALFVSEFHDARLTAVESYAFECSKTLLVRGAERQLDHLRIHSALFEDSGDGPLGRCEECSYVDLAACTLDGLAGVGE